MSVTIPVMIGGEQRSAESRWFEVRAHDVARFVVPATGESEARHKAYEYEERHMLLSQGILEIGWVAEPINGDRQRYYSKVGNPCDQARLLELRESGLVVTETEEEPKQFELLQDTLF